MQIYDGYCGYVRLFDGALIYAYRLFPTFYNMSKDSCGISQSFWDKSISIWDTELRYPRFLSHFIV